jgi:hypothetical protein
LVPAPAKELRVWTESRNLAGAIVLADKIALPELVSLSDLCDLHWN